MIVSLINNLYFYGFPVKSYFNVRQKYNNNYIYLGLVTCTQT